jgi:hypothetical protein
LLGRFRAVPDTRRRSRSGSGLFGTFNASRLRQDLFGPESENGDGESEDGERGLRGWGTRMRDLWLEPKQVAVRRAVDRWWSRWAMLVVLPAALVS